MAKINIGIVSYLDFLQVMNEKITKVLKKFPEITHKDYTRISNDILANYFLNETGKIDVLTGKKKHDKTYKYYMYKAIKYGKYIRKFINKVKNEKITRLIIIVSDGYDSFSVLQTFRKMFKMLVKVITVEDVINVSDYDRIPRELELQEFIISEHKKYKCNSILLVSVKKESRSTNMANNMANPRKIKLTYHNRKTLITDWST